MGKEREDGNDAGPARARSRWRGGHRRCLMRIATSKLDVLTTLGRRRAGRRVVAGAALCTLLFLQPPPLPTSGGPVSSHHGVRTPPPNTPPATPHPTFLSVGVLAAP